MKSRPSRKATLPWKSTFKIAWSNLRTRPGKSSLSVGVILVMVSFYTLSLTYEGLLEKTTENTEVHSKALLERAGVVTEDPDSMRRYADRREFLLWISGLLCIVGVANTMSIAVTERFREIGALKCLGAVDSLVVRLFLVEAFLIGSIAGFLGCFVGSMLAIIQYAAVLEVTLLSPAEWFESLLKGLLPSIPIGPGLAILGSVFPVWLASRMQPVDAMRVEP